MFDPDRFYISVLEARVPITLQDGMVEDAEVDVQDCLEEVEEEQLM